MRPQTTPSPAAPRLTRRRFCAGAAAGSVSLALGGCASAGLGRSGGRAALLLPLSGEAGALGRNMARAATLVAPADGAEIPAFDTEDTVAGARAAATRALDGGARLLLGPLRADQTPGVLDVAGDVPVVTFSNDDRLAGGGAFVMGVTPAQSVAAAFSYARAQGVRRVAVVAAPGPLGDATATAARRIAPAGGLTLTAVLARGDGAGLVEALGSASGGSLPDAVFIPDGGAPLMAFATALSGAGPRLMGGVQWGVAEVEGAPALEGAWFAAPSPNVFASFLDAFDSRFGEPAGLVTALGHDAALMAAVLGAARRVDRAGVTRAEGFAGALGPFRFLDDGRCQRDLAVLTVEGGRTVAIGEVAGT